MPGMIYKPLYGSDLIESYAELGVKKAERKATKIILLGFISGVFVAFGGVASNTIIHSIANPGMTRLISGMVWPIGLAIVMLLGGELFLGNTMMVISVLEKKITIPAMLRNWALVYMGNLFGGLFISALIVFTGQLELNDGALAVFTIQLAAGKLSPGFVQEMVSGMLCNLLVCAAVLCSMTAKDTTGKILGAYIPVLYFIVGGFDNAVANMYLVPAGLLAVECPKYVALAINAGVDISILNWGNYLGGNLLPVSIGNCIAGMGLSSLLWYCHSSGTNVIQS